MGQAKIKKLLQDKAVGAANAIDKDKLAAAVRHVVKASTDFHGADCLLFAALGAEALRQLGVPAEVAAGSAAWRVGPGDSDVISHAREVTGTLYIQSGVQQALQFHAWIEAPGLLIDFSTHTLPLKAAQLDEADGGRTSVNWAPDFLWIDQEHITGRRKTPGDVVQAPNEGQFCYVRHLDIENTILPTAAIMIREAPSAVAATIAAYRSLIQGSQVQVISYGEDGSLQEEPDHQSLIRVRPGDRA